MYVIIWEHQVQAAHLIEFEKIYHANGAWEELFRKAPGYISTELLRDGTNPNTYITIDRWNSSESYETFHSQFKKEYEMLDVQCEELTEHEILIGKWESVNNETR
ncbi:MAG: antibiotic biosynthesis monooxygenase [Chloroflexota bacterium]|nr:antibiotic biosynthesis monooxygenase [Chloroflexota bacterium]